MNLEKKYKDNLIKAILNLESKSEVEAFLNALLTPAEMEAIPIRLEIIRLLKKGIKQREISNKLGVGIATVTRGSTELKKGNFKSIK